MNSNIAPMLKIENNVDKNMSKELIIVIDDQEQTFCTLINGSNIQLSYTRSTVYCFLV